MTLKEFLTKYGITHIGMHHNSITLDSDITFVGTSREEVYNDIKSFYKTRKKLTKNLYERYPVSEYSWFTINELKDVMS